MAMVNGWGTIPPAAASPPPFTVQLDWVYNVQFAGLLLAHHKGLYAQRGLAIALRPWEPGLVVTDAVTQQPLTIGCAEQNLILEAQAQGAPIKAIATLFQTSPLALMSLPDRAIRHLSDLAGQSVGVHVDGIKVMALALGMSGLAPDAIRVVEINHDDKFDRLRSGEFAAVQCYAVDEPLVAAQQLGVEPDLLPLDQYGYDAYAQVLFTTDAMLANYAEPLMAFLQATFAGWRIALADIPGTAALVAGTYAEQGSPYTNLEYQRRSLERVGDYVMQGITPVELGTIRGDRWQQTAERMAAYGIIARAPDLDQSVDLSLWTGNPT